MTEYKTLRTEQSDAVLTVRLNSPPRNLLDEVVGADLAALIETLDRDPAVRAVIITGEPERTFITRYRVPELLRDSPGFSLTFRQAQVVVAVARAAKRIGSLERLLRHTPAKGVLNLQRLNDTFRRMTRMDKVFIAALNGMTVGAGMLIALACDVRLVASDAGPLGLPEPTIGFFPGAGGPQRATRMLGPARALEVLLDGTTFSPVEAEAIGLVNAVVPRSELMSESEAWAKRLARRPPEVIKATKRLVYHGVAAPRVTRREEAALLATLSGPLAKHILTEFTARLGHEDETDADQVEAYRLAREGVLGT